MIVVGCAALLASCQGYTATSPGAAPGEIIIRNVSIISGPAFEPVWGQEVAIQDGRITAVRRQSHGVPVGTQVIDGQAGYLVPGFIDMHAHILIPRCSRSPGVTERFDVALSERMLGVLLESGITTLRSPANPTEQGLALRDRANDGTVRAPFIRAAAELINDPRLSPNAMREQIRQMLPFRPDYIKLYARIGPEALAAGIEESHAHGISVIGHLGSSSWTEGARAGIDFLTHAADWSAKTLRPADRPRYEADVSARGAFRARITWLELLDLQSPEVRDMVYMVGRRRIPIDPTLVAYEAKFSPPDDPRFRGNARRDALPELRQDWNACGRGTEDWTAEDYARWRSAYPKLGQLLRLFERAGVPLLVGTDVTNPWVIPGESYHQEMELLVHAGFTPAEVLRMATMNAANALALANEIGQVHAGFQADLVLLKRNPLEDISRSREIAWVMEDGSLIR
jgi:cytosine/adenosine deaminase-related metal-dependent hydrolase